MPSCAAKLTRATVLNVQSLDGGAMALLAFRLTKLNPLRIFGKLT